MKPAAFQGAYSDLRFVKSRSVAQVVIELPIEQAGAFVAHFGAPVPGAEVPVAIARLVEQKAASIAPESALAAKRRRPFSSLSLAQQAGMRCEEPTFRTFLRETRRYHGDVADYVRHYCGVVSRSQLALDNESGARWLKLNREYETWLARAECVP